MKQVRLSTTSNSFALFFDSVFLPRCPAITFTRLITRQLTLMSPAVPVSFLVASSFCLVKSKIDCYTGHWKRSMADSLICTGFEPQNYLRDRCKKCFRLKNKHDDTPMTPNSRQSLAKRRSYRELPDSPGAADNDGAHFSS